MTESELFAVMVAAFSTVSGSVLAGNFEKKYNFEIHNHKINYNFFISSLYWFWCTA
jgi:nucleoside permease NupC